MERKSRMLSDLIIFLGQIVFVRQGSEGAESSSYASGRLKKIGRNRQGAPKGAPISLIFEDGQVVGYDKDITTVSPVIDPHKN